MWQIGGESSSGLGGYYSVGGRLARKQIANCMANILTLAVDANTLLKCGSNIQQIIAAILMLLEHNIFEAKSSAMSLPFPQANTASSGFGSGAINSPPHAASLASPTSAAPPSLLAIDVKFATVATSGILRALCAAIGESTQILILTELAGMLISEKPAEATSSTTSPGRERSVSLTIKSEFNQQQLQVSSEAAQSGALSSLPSSPRAFLSSPPHPAPRSA